jgi:hypothetical protein
VRLWAAADALRDAIGAPLPPLARAERDREVVALKAALGEEAFTTAWSAGGTLTPGEAAALAVGESSEA